MKVKVVKLYRDKYTRAIHKPDDELEISKERFEEINSTARGVFVEEIKSKQRTKKEADK